MVLRALPLLLLGSCAAPLQNGGVEVRPGAIERMEFACRFRAPGAGCAASPESEESVDLPAPEEADEADEPETPPATVAPPLPGHAP